MLYLILQSSSNYKPSSCLLNLTAPHLQLKKEFGVNYAFPRSDDKDQDTITIMGRREQVEKAAANLRESIKELENTAEDEIQIDGEYFKKVTSRSVSRLLS